MRFAEASGFFNEMGARILSGDVAGVAARFEVPIPVYIDDRLLVLGSAAVAEEALGQFLAHIRARGVTQMRAEVTGIELPRGPVQRIWVRWHFLDGAGQCVGADRVSYVVRDGRTLEMVVYSEVAFPELVRELPLAA